MADMRAMEEQTYRQQMHGGAFHGAGIVGAGATPSMGLSQFRGGASHKCPDCRRKRCMCEESSSDEEMEGGAGLSGLFGAVGDAASAAIRNLRNLRNIRPTVPRPSSSAIVPYNPGQAAFTSNSAFRNYALNRIFAQPSTTLATRTPGTLKPYSAAEAAARVRAAQAAGETNVTVAQKLARMGITPARVAAALALGIPAIALAIYFGEIDGTDPDGGPFIPPPPPPPPPPGGPGGPGGPGDTGVPRGPRGPRGRRATGEGVATGNLADAYYAAQMMGAGKKPRRPNPRAAIVRDVMREKGLSLPAASKYVKENGLY